MGDRVPASDAMEHVPVGTNQDMASKKVAVLVRLACAKVPRFLLAVAFERFCALVVTEASD